MAKLDRAALDKARNLNNLPPLTDAEFLGLQGNDDLSDEEKLAKAEAERKQFEADAEQQRLANLEKNKNQPVELSEEELLELVSKKTGRKISSLTELIPAEVIDKEKAAEERENEKFAWGLKTGKIKQKEVESFITASKNPKSLVYEMRLQQAKKEDKNFDEKEFEAEFNEEFAIDADPTTRRYKNGQDTLSRLADAILQKNYSSVYNLENEYSGYEKSQQSQKQQQAKIKEEAPKFKASLDRAMAHIKKIKVQFGQNEEYEVEAIDDAINTVRQQMSDPAWVEKQILEGYTEDSLKEVAYTAFLRQAFPVLAEKIAVQHLRKHAAGTKGVLTVKNSSSVFDESQLTDEQKKLKTIIEENNPQPAQVN